MLSINNPIIATDISTINVIRSGTVYRLSGVAQDSVIVKFEIGDVNQFKLHKKFVNAYDRANIWLRLLKPPELQAMESKLVAPPVWIPAVAPAPNPPAPQGWVRGVLPAPPVAPPPQAPAIAQALGQAEVQVLRQCIRDAKNNANKFGVKMSNLAGLEDAGDLDLTAPLPRPANFAVRQTAFSNVFFTRQPHGLVQAAWEKLGKIAAVDFFVGNADRFDPLYPQKPFKAIRNLGNHMFLGNEPIGLDTWDPNSATRDLTVPFNQQKAPRMAKSKLAEGVLYSIGYLQLGSTARDNLAAKVVADYKQIAGIVGPAPLADQQYQQWFITGLMAGRAVLLSKIAAIRSKHPQNPLPAGIDLLEKAMPN